MNMSKRNILRSQRRTRKYDQPKLQRFFLSILFSQVIVLLKIIVNFYLRALFLLRGKAGYSETFDILIRHLILNI